MRQLLPDAIRPPLRKVWRILRHMKYAGDERYCPVCNHHSKLFGVVDGVVPREDAQCMYCGALERHRLVWRYLQTQTNLLASHSLKMLHVAPEPFYEEHFIEQLGVNYLTADLYNPGAMVKMDITNIRYPDDSFDVIYCSHVLEHVPDDRKAMSEFYRVLKSGGWAILLVPILREQTFEDPTITDPAERLRVFGQHDHVRIYGQDYVDRLREAGFDVDVEYPDNFMSKEEIVRMGITKAAGEIYLCKKPAVRQTNRI
jgi:SAM-dependent methyltransferase